MPITQRVALEGIRFFAFHGFYEEEQLIGNEFMVDVFTEMDVSSDGSDDISNTVNYERLFEIIAAEMRQTRKLLETVAHGIMARMLAEFPLVDRAEVRIRKMNLPLPGEVKNSLIQLNFRK